MTLRKLLISSLIGIASAANIDIQVSDDSDALSFNPSSTTANKGDTITWHFFPHNHNVVQGSFDQPCQPLDNGFYSGFITSDSGEANTTFSIQVTDSNPIWYYCSQGTHCNGGMAGVINPGSDTQIDDYQSAAKSASVGSPSATAGFGGTLSSAGSSASGTSLSGTASSATSSASGSDAMAASTSVSNSTVIGGFNSSATSTTSPTGKTGSTAPSSGAGEMGLNIPALVALIAGNFVLV